MNHVIELSACDPSWDGETVTIRAKRSFAAQRKVDQSGMVARTDGDGSDARFTIDMLERSLTILETAIVEWTLPIPADRSGFMHDDFDADLGEWLVEHINSYYEGQRRDPTNVETSIAVSTAH